MGSQEEQTIVVSGTDCPLWDASMQFQVKDLHEDTLCITVFDKGYYSPDGKEFFPLFKINILFFTDFSDLCFSFYSKQNLWVEQKFVSLTL